MAITKFIFSAPTTARALLSYKQVLLSSLVTKFYYSLQFETFFYLNLFLNLIKNLAVIIKNINEYKATEGIKKISNPMLSKIPK